MTAELWAELDAPARKTKPRKTGKPRKRKPATGVEVDVDRHLAIQAVAWEPAPGGEACKPCAGRGGFASGLDCRSCGGSGSTPEGATTPVWDYADGKPVQS